MPVRSTYTLSLTTTPRRASTQKVMASPSEPVTFIATTGRFSSSTRRESRRSRRGW